MKFVLGGELRRSCLILVSLNQLLGKVEVCYEKKEGMRVIGAYMYSSR